MHPIVKMILNMAVFAPSGDNSQPWQFKCRGLVFDIINLPDRDNKIFNYNQHGSYIAHGALLENIVSLAPVFGAEASFVLFPEKNNRDIVASVTLKITGRAKKQETLKLIQLRSTNRKKYKPYVLLDAEKSKLQDNFHGETNVSLVLTEDKQNIGQIARAVSTPERIMLEYEPLHHEFFDLIRWNGNHESESKFGMNIDTLELTPPQKLIFKWFSNWKFSAILRKLGLPKFIAKENSKIYASASAVAAITTASNAPESYIQTGQLLQRTWLTITKLGLSMQPIAGVLYLDDQLEAGGLAQLPNNLKVLIKDSVSTVYNAMGNPSDKIVMLFRIGKSEPPSALSKKNPPIFK